MRPELRVPSEQRVTLESQRTFPHGIQRSHPGPAEVGKLQEQPEGIGAGLMPVPDGSEGKGARTPAPSTDREMRLGGGECAAVTGGVRYRTPSS